MYFCGHVSYYVSSLQMWTLLRWCPNVITDGTFITLGSKCYYRWDLYYAWVQKLLQMGPLLRLGPFITLVPSTRGHTVFLPGFRTLGSTGFCLHESGHFWNRKYCYPDSCGRSPYSVLTRISYTGVHRPIEKLKGGREGDGEKWVTTFRWSQLNVFTGLSLR